MHSQKLNKEYVPFRCRPKSSEFNPKSSKFNPKSSKTQNHQKIMKKNKLKINSILTQSQQNFNQKSLVATSIRATSSNQKQIFGQIKYKLIEIQIQILRGVHVHLCHSPQFISLILMRQRAHKRGGFQIPPTPREIKFYTLALLKCYAFVVYHKQTKLFSAFKQIFDKAITFVSLYEEKKPLSHQYHR